VLLLLQWVVLRRPPTPIINIISRQALLPLRALL